MKPYKITFKEKNRISKELFTSYKEVCASSILTDRSEAYIAYQAYKDGVEELFSKLFELVDE